MAAYKQYINELWGEFAYLATWMPNVTVRLGDIGEIIDGQFEHRTTLTDLGVAFEKVQAGNAMPLVYRSKGSQVTKLGAGGTALPGGASHGASTVRIDFKTAHGILFAAQNCTPWRIKIIDDLQQPIRDLRDQGLWKPNYIVATQVVNTSAATILISSDADASVEFTAKTSLDPANLAQLADINADIGTSSSFSISNQFICQRNATPLFKASRLGWKLFQGRRLVPARRGTTAESSNEPPNDLEDLTPDTLL